MTNRVGQVWQSGFDGAVFVVIGEPNVAFPGGAQVSTHLAVILDASTNVFCTRARGEVCDRYERDASPWESNSSMKRII